MSLKPSPEFHLTKNSGLRLFRRQDHCQVLGPGTRAVLWVQGCSLACPGCLVPQSWKPKGGEFLTVDQLSDWLCSLDGISGVTLSGGEPFEQSQALCQLIDQVNLRRSFNWMSYTGYLIEELTGQWPRQLLGRLDLLIDGPYRQELHQDLLWRASSNQRIHDLTGRCSLPAADRTAGLDFEFLPDGRLTFSGVPPWPEFHLGAPFR